MGGSQFKAYPFAHYVKHVIDLLIFVRGWGNPAPLGSIPCLIKRYEKHQHLLSFLLRVCSMFWSCLKCRQARDKYFRWMPSSPECLQNFLRRVRQSLVQRSQSRFGYLRAFLNLPSSRPCRRRTDRCDCRPRERSHWFSGCFLLVFR